MMTACCTLDSTTEIDRLKRSVAEASLELFQERGTIPGVVSAIFMVKERKSGEKKV